MSDPKEKKHEGTTPLPMASSRLPPPPNPERHPTVRQVRMNPKIARGLPCLDGTQIPVTVYLELFKKGYTVDRIVAECYPELTREDILFALDFVIDWVRRAPGYLSNLMDTGSMGGGD
ncbi:MAG: DUF433 domain-containing protein [Leptospirillia bacterium]